MVVVFVLGGMLIWTWRTKTIELPWIPICHARSLRKGPAYHPRTTNVLIELAPVSGGKLWEMGFVHICIFHLHISVVGIGVGSGYTIREGKLGGQFEIWSTYNALATTWRGLRLQTSTRKPSRDGQGPLPLSHAIITIFVTWAWPKQ